MRNKEMSDAMKPLLKSILGRDDGDLDDLKRWHAEIEQSLGEVVGNDIKEWAEQYRHWDRTYRMCQVSEMQTGRVDWTVKSRAVLMAVRYEKLIGPDAAHRIKLEVDAEIRRYVGDKGFGV